MKAGLHRVSNTVVAVQLAGPRPVPQDYNRAADLLWLAMRMVMAIESCDSAIQLV